MVTHTEGVCSVQRQFMFKTLLTSTQWLETSDMQQRRAPGGNSLLLQESSSSGTCDGLSNGGHGGRTEVIKDDPRPGCSIHQAD